MRRAVLVANVVANKDTPLERLKESIKVEEVSLPQPGPGQVLVRVECSPINPSDIGNLGGSYNIDNRGALPAPLGLEGCGTVVAAGPGLLSMRVTGRRVACVTAAGGIWGEYVLADATQCAPLPNDVAFEEGCSVFVNPMTVMAMISIAKDGRHKAILHTAAASQLGKMLIRVGRRYNIRILCLVRKDEQSNELLSLGVDPRDVFCTRHEKWAAQLSARCSELNCRLCFDAVGGSLTGQLMSCMPRGAQVQVYGALSGEPSSGITTKSLVEKEQSLCGLYLTNVFRKRGLRWAIPTLSTVTRLLKTDFKTEVAKRFSLDDVPEAILSYLNNMSSGKVVICPSMRA